MLTPTLMSLLFAVGCVAQAAILYYILIKRKPTSANSEEQQNTVTGNIGNLAARDVVIKKEKSKPCERERFYFAQCKDLSNTVNTLFKQLQHKDKMNAILQARLKAADKMIHQLQEQNRRLPVLPIGTWKKEERV